MGFEVGLSIPLWMGAQKAKITAAKTGAAIMATESENYQRVLIARYQALQSDLEQYEEGLSYYESAGKQLAEETLYHAIQAFQNGEIDFLQYIQLLENAKTIETNYLNTLFQYNRTVLEANYLMNL